MVSVTVLIFNFPNGCDAPSALLNKNARNFDLKVRYNAALNLTHDIPFNSISIAFLVHYWIKKLSAKKTMDGDFKIVNIFIVC